MICRDVARRNYSTDELCNLIVIEVGHQRSWCRVFLTIASTLKDCVKVQSS
jgi:hypothetical protein